MYSVSDAGGRLSVDNYDEKLWSCPASVVVNGESTFDFVTRKTDSPNAGILTPLLDYNGKKVGTLIAYNEKVIASEYPRLPDELTKGAIFVNSESEPVAKDDLSVSDCNYPNGNQKIIDNKYRLKNGSYMRETITPGNLHFAIERNYTDVDRDTYYVVRAVNNIGEESPPSEISELVCRHADEKAVMTFTGSVNAESENIVAYRLYRASGGTKGSDFLYVGEIKGVTGGEFHDTLSEEELNEVMPKYGSVPKELQGICGMSGGFMAAYKGKDIYFSEPYMPYCFPWEYSQSVPFDIVGMAVRGNYLYVMTKGSLYAFVGDHPESITPLAMRFDVPCISRKSIAHVNGSIIYAGTTGLVVIDNGGARVFSDKLYTLEQYKALHFEDCVAAGEYDGKYLAIFEDKALLFDFSDQNIVHTTVDASGFSVGTYSWNDGSWKDYEENFRSYNTPYGETFVNQDFSSKNLRAEWKSKDFVFERPIAFTCGRVRFDKHDSPINIKLFAENVEVFSGEVHNSTAFRIPVLRRECRWSVSVSGNCDITSIELAESMSEL
jgi:hypothetical protein